MLNIKLSITFAQMKKLQKHFFLFFKGLLMGLANKIPGVSGGTVAFVMGFYQELMYSFQKFNGKALKLLLNGKFKMLYQYLNLSFLIYLTSGIITSYFTISILLDYFLEYYEKAVWSLFFGLIIGSIYYTFRQLKNFKFQGTLFLLVGLFIGISLSFVVPAQANPNVFFVFFCGWVSVCGMTLPGLSGSFILVLLGNYQLLMVDTVNATGAAFLAILSGDATFFTFPENMNYLKILAVFVLGSLAGFITMAHILTYLLKKFQNQLNALIIGFIVGSLIVVYPWKNISENKQFHLYIPDFKQLQTYGEIALIILGFFVVLMVMHFEKKRQQRKMKY